MMRVVAALGGNALLRRGEPSDADTQRRNVTVAAAALARLARDHELIVTRGNGPQVGQPALRSEAERDVRPYPLDVLTAETEGMIGYLLEQGHRNGFEYNVVLAAAVFALAGVGAGAWSLGEALDINLAGTGWALAALGAGALGGLGAIVSGHLALASPIPTQQEGRSGHGQIAGQPLD